MLPQGVSISHLLVVLVVQTNSEILFCVSLEGELGSYSKAALLFLDCSFLVSVFRSLPRLASV